MGKIKDLSGREFGEWTVLSLDGERSTPRIKKWICKCSCGNIVSVQSANLVTGASTKCSKCAGTENLNLNGKIFGEWKVLRKGKKKRSWLCECSCGDEYEIHSSHLKMGVSTKCRKCAGTELRLLVVGSKYNKITVVDNFNIKGNWFVIGKCDCGRTISKISKRDLETRYKSCKYCANWKGYEEISSSWWNSQKRSAIERNLEFSITIKFVWDLYLKQDRKCSLSGLSIEFYKNPSKNYNLQTASLDRIDNKIGYIDNNIQLVHKKLNFMKHINSQEDFIAMCNLVSKKHFMEVDALSFKYGSKCTVKN